MDLTYDDKAYLSPLSWVQMLQRTLQATDFWLHLKYEKLPLTRCGDVIVMEFAMELGLDKYYLL